MADISERQLKVLEKLIGDMEFRAGFLEDPDAAIAKAGIDLSEEELAGLKGLDFNALGSALVDLDARLSKSAATVITGAAEGFTEVLGQFFSTTT
jgi:hypothetical protein